MATGVKSIWALERVAETTYGTPVALTTGAITNPKRFPTKGNRPKIEIEGITDEDYSVGSYTPGTTQVLGKKWGTASFEFDCRLDALATYLKGVMGAPTTTGADPYAHTFVPVEGDSPSFTAYWYDVLTTATKLEQFPGTKVTRLTLSGVAGGKLTLKAELMMNGVHTEIVCATPALSSSSEAVLCFQHISTFTIGGTDYKSKLQEFELVFENVYDDAAEFAAGNTTLPSLERTQFKISGSMKLKHEVNGLGGLLADIEASTSRAIVMTIQTGASYGVTFNLYNCFFEPTEVDGGIGKLSTSIGFKCLYSPSDSKAVQAVVTNSVTTYA